MTSETKAETPHYVGHRQRLRERLMRTGGDGMQDYELLELLLCLAIPRRDVKPLAKALLARFGSYAEVLSAEPEHLMEIKGMGETAIAALKLTLASLQRFTQDSVIKKPVFSHWETLLKHCRANMAFLTAEQFRVLFLNNKNALIADEVMWRGTMNHTPAYPREIAKRAVQLNAVSIIISHNHPSGDPDPSKDDIKMTREIVRVCREVDVTVHDHLIVAKTGHASMKAMGLMAAM